MYKFLCKFYDPSQKERSVSNQNARKHFLRMLLNYFLFQIRNFMSDLFTFFTLNFFIFKFMYPKIFTLHF